MKEKKRISLVVIGSVVLVTLLVSVLLFREYNNVYKECYVEAGVSVSPEDFFKNAAGEISFVESSDVIDTNVPGEYQVVLKRNSFTHKSTLYVSDTIAPTGQSVNVTLGKGEVCQADAFVSDVEDATEVTITYKKEPDFSKM